MALIQRIANYFFPQVVDFGKQQLVGIQSMRGIAASLVIIDHLMDLLCNSNIISNTWLQVGWNLGTAGVYLFFAISGFVMVLTNEDKFSSVFSTFDFICRRLIRIWPLYALATLIAYISRAGSAPWYLFENLVMSLSFIPYIGAGGDFRPIVGQGWTLNYEMFFYLIFAIALSMKRSVGLSFVLITILFFGVYEQPVPINSVESFYFNSVVLYFLLGVTIAVLYKGGWLEKFFITNAICAVVLSSLILVAFVFIFGFFSSNLFKTLTGLVCIGLALVAVCSSNMQYSNNLLKKILLSLGNASFSIYLFHGFILGHAKNLFNANQPADGILIAVALFASSLLFGIFIHRAIENPAQIIFTNKYKLFFKIRAATQIK